MQSFFEAGSGPLPSLLLNLNSSASATCNYRHGPPEVIALLFRGRENLAAVEKSWEDWTNTRAEGESLQGRREDLILETVFVRTQF